MFLFHRSPDTDKNKKKAIFKLVIFLKQKYVFNKSSRQQRDFYNYLLF